MSLTPNPSQTTRDAIAFVDSLELPHAPRRTRGAPVPDFKGFEGAKDQGVVVGSDIVSFVAGVPAQQRELIVNCSLLAQLAANKRVPDRDDIRAWYDAYFSTLNGLGWVTEERGFSEHRETGNNFEANKAIMSIAAVVLGGAASALAVVQSTLDAMKAMADGPWMTIFTLESQTAKAARFQVTVGQPTPAGGSELALLAFELEAASALTQALFFKYRSADITLRHASGRVTVGAVTEATAPAIAAKVAPFVQKFVADLEI